MEGRPEAGLVCGPLSLRAQGNILIFFDSSCVLHANDQNDELLVNSRSNRRLFKYALNEVAFVVKAAEARACCMLERSDREAAKCLSTRSVSAGDRVTEHTRAYFVIF